MPLVVRSMFRDQQIPKQEDDSFDDTNSIVAREHIYVWHGIKDGVGLL